MVSTKYVIHVSIVHPQSVTRILGEYDYLPVKMPTGSDAAVGEVMQTPDSLRGLEGHIGLMVIFAKLSVKMPGIFRPKMTLYQNME